MPGRVFPFEVLSSKSIDNEASHCETIEASYKHHNTGLTMELLLKLDSKTKFSNINPDVEKKFADLVFSLAELIYGGDTHNLDESQMINEKLLDFYFSTLSL